MPKDKKKKEEKQTISAPIEVTPTEVQGTEVQGTEVQPTVVQEVSPTGLNPAEENTARPEEVDRIRKTGIFHTEPKPVAGAASYKDPSMLKKIFGHGLSPLPIIGDIASAPLRKAYENKAAAMKQDVDTTNTFWKAMDEDPVYAKQLLRVDRFRDALQRRHGMSGDQILELDKGITEEGILARKDIYKSLIQKGYAPEGGFETELGKLERAPESQKGRYTIDQKTGLPMDTWTGKIDVKQAGNIVDALKANIQKNMPDMPEDEAYLMAIGMANRNNKMARNKVTVLSGGRGLYLEDSVTGKGRVIKTNLGEKPNWVNEAYNSTGIPGMVDGIILYNKNAENASDTGIVIRFDEMLMPDGSTAKSRIEAELKRLGNTPEAKSRIMEMISKFTGFFTFDNSPGMEFATPQRGTTAPAVNRQPVSAPPVNIQRAPAPQQVQKADEVEIQKTNNFFTGM